MQQKLYFENLKTVESFARHTDLYYTPTPRDQSALQIESNATKKHYQNIFVFGLSFLVSIGQLIFGFFYRLIHGIFGNSLDSRFPPKKFVSFSWPIRNNWIIIVIIFEL